MEKTELEKYRAVNACETIEELIAAILEIVDEEGMIQGRSKKFNGEKMAMSLKLVSEGIFPPNTLTREYGIRQQAIYIMFCEAAERNENSSNSARQ
jgi:hypothetical protein